VSFLSRFLDPAFGNGARPYWAATVCFVVASLCLFRFASGAVTRYVGIMLLFTAGLTAWLADRRRDADLSSAHTFGRGSLFLIAIGLAALVGLLSLPQRVVGPIRHVLVVATRALLGHR
jgi:hypothetical protein